MWLWWVGVWKVKTDFKTNLKSIWARAYVRIVGANREPSWILSETVLPLLNTAAFVYVYKALNAPEEYIGFVILGGAMTAYWMNVLWSMASQFYWEKEMGNLELYLIAPISRMSILLGMAIGGIFYATLRALVVFIFGSLLFRVNFFISGLWELFLIFILTMIALYGLGMLFASLFMLWGREAWHTSNLFQEPIYLLGGFFFPVKTLGYTVAMCASAIPISLGLDGMRQLSFKTGKTLGFLDVKIEILLLFGLSILYVWVSHYALLFMENLGKKQGRLTLKWQ